MSGMWGNNIRLSIFGESHGKGIGITIDGLCAGIELDIEYIKSEMSRRAPGQSEIETQRKEGDSFEILSGILNGRTTGTPLCAVIYNTNQNSKDYEEQRFVMRPSHADYTAYIKYNGYNDYRGGGHFSGRLTAPIVFAGAICKQILKKMGVLIGAHIKSIGNLYDNSFNPRDISSSLVMELTKSRFPLINQDMENSMKKLILDAKEAKDSVGGVIETAVINLKPGIGEPFFNSVESNIAQLLFSIPGVKGVEFGAGFEITRLNGSLANDEYYYEDGKIKTYTNNNGGISGGITNGMPLILKVAIKPTPSIGVLQRTIDIKDKSNTSIEIVGRHDPCIVPRAVPVVEAAVAIAILDLIN